MAGLRDCFFLQIDLDPQEIAEIVFQSYEPQQPHFGIVDLNQQIEVAALPGLAPSIGTEDARGPDIKRPGQLTNQKNLYHHEISGEVE